MSSIFFRVFRSEGELTLGSGSSSGRAGGFSELRMDGREFGGEEKRTFENLIQQFLLPWIAFNCLLKNPEKLQELPGELPGPDARTDIVKGAGLAARPFSHSVTEPGFHDLEAGDLKIEVLPGFSWVIR